MPADLARVREVVTARVGQVRRLVKQRLTGEINYWDMRHAELLEAEAAGKQLRMRPQAAYDRARDLERRLEKRLADLALDEELIARPPVVSGGALIVPQGLLDKLLGRTPDPSAVARDTALTERRAVDAVLAVERRLGRDPEEMPHANPGYDIRSRTADGRVVFIEVGPGEVDPARPPSTLHLWWARRPLAACRAVLFAQLVDDPSAHPEEFPTEQDQRKERDRLHGIISRLVVWENIHDEALLKEAREEIVRSCGGNPPPVLDPFAGGGSIPLEAQRLGLEAHASDPNPVAVLINKALIEIPPKFADDVTLLGLLLAEPERADQRRQAGPLRDRRPLGSPA